MYKLPSKAMVDNLRRRFPPGTRVELVRMNDEFSRLKPGDRGTVEFVDDCGTLFCSWDRGSRLGVVFGVDHAVKIEDADDE